MILYYSEKKGCDLVKFIFGGHNPIKLRKLPLNCRNEDPYISESDPGHSVLFSKEEIRNGEMGV